MRADVNDRQLRRYVLGAANEEETEAIERAYFERADALDEIRAAEDDLIEDYLSGRLRRDERERFERDYLASPGHRRRVAVLRAIRTAASAARPSEVRRSVPWLTAAGVAAALVLVVAAAMWMAGPGSDSTNTTAATGATPPSPASSPSSKEGVGDRAATGTVARQPPVSSSQPPPAIAALSISPILVRSADEPASLTIRPGTDVVRLLLQAGPADEALTRGRAIVRTVAGQEVWRGPAADASGTSPRELSRVDIPAASLAPDDYIVQLFGTAAGGVEVERHRYFFSIREP